MSDRDLASEKSGIFKIPVKVERKADRKHLVSLLRQIQILEDVGDFWTEGRVKIVSDLIHYLRGKQIDGMV